MAGGRSVIRHTPTKKIERNLNLLQGRFTEALSAKARTMLLPGGELEKLDWAEATDTALLTMRRSLAEEIKRGMLERKDQELEIAVKAMLVWFMRQEDAARERLLEAWG